MSDQQPIEAFPDNSWYVAGWSDELADGKLLDRTIMGQRLVLYRTEDGEVVVLHNRCPHRSAPLSMGKREGDNLRCGYHGMLFGTDGRCVAIPGQDIIPENAAVRTYPVTERHGWIWVWPGNPELADLGSIPSVTAPDDPAWTMRTGYVHYNAGAELLHDNLLDFSHVQFVHDKSFGGGANWSDQPEIERLDDGFRFTRWLTDVPVAPFLREMMPHAPNQDILGKYDFVMPGLLRVDIQSQTTGTGTRDALSSDGYFRSISSQAVTPETATTSHYFYSAGIPRGVPEFALDATVTGMVMAFEEDRSMIEAQQAELLAHPDERISRVALAADGPLVKMRAMLKKRALADGAPAEAAAS